MKDWLVKMYRFLPFHHEGPIEREKMARLESAEQDLRDLQMRGERAVRLLTERDKRNHWQEAVGQMIQGGV